MAKQKQKGLAGRGDGAIQKFCCSPKALAWGRDGEEAAKKPGDGDAGDARTPPEPALGTCSPADAAGVCAEVGFSISVRFPVPLSRSQL